MTAMPLEWFGGCGVRHIQVLLLLMCSMVECGMLQSFRVSVFLVDKDIPSNYTLFDDPYRQAIQFYTSQQKMIIINGWVILGFAGSLAGGYLTLLVNLKYLLLGITASVTLLTYITPNVVTSSGYDTVLTITLLTGFIHGMKDPTVVALIARWIPHSEIGRALSLIFTSSALAQVTTILIFTFLRDSPSSWTTIYYLMGNTGILWCVSWYAFGCPNPSRCFYVSNKERLMINKNIPLETNKKSNYIPWPAIFKSVPFYGVLISQILTKWIFNLMYFTHFMQSYMFARGAPYDPKVYALVILISALIPPTQYLIATAVENVVKNKKYPSRYVRKTFNSIALWGECVCCVLLSYTTTPVCDMILYLIFNHLGCLAFQGYTANYFDVERRLSGFICGLVNFFSLIPLAFCCNYSHPILIVVTDNSFETVWRSRYDTVWLTGAFTCFIGNFFYIIMATDETDPMLPASSK